MPPERSQNVDSTVHGSAHTERPGNTAKTIAADPAVDDAVAATMDLRRVSKDAEISGSRGRLSGTVIIFGGYIIWIHLRNPRELRPRAQRERFAHERPVVYSSVIAFCALSVVIFTL